MPLAIGTDARWRNSYWLILLAALAIGAATALAGFGLDHLLYQHRRLFASDVLEGVAAAVLSGMALLRLERRRRDSLLRIQAVEDVNHHVRNALTAVTYSAVLRDDPVLDAIVRDANERVDWTLREVLPRTVRSFDPGARENCRWNAGLSLEADEAGMAREHTPGER